MRSFDPPLPSFPREAVSDLVPDILKTKNTIPNHEAERLAPILLAIAAKHLARMSDAALRPLGLCRLPQP